MPIRAIAEDRTPEQKFSDVVALMQSRKFAEALPLLVDLETRHPTPAAYWNLGLSAAELGDDATALRAWRELRSAAPDDWRARAKLVQTFQALGDLQARDRERAELVARWQGGQDAPLSAQQLYCRDQFNQAGHRIVVLEYFSPSAPARVLYSFVAVNGAGQQDFRVSLGSDDTTNRVALELGQRTPDQRIWHLDLDRPGLHETYGVFPVQTGYDGIRAAVVDVLAGRRKPISASRAASAASD